MRRSLGLAMLAVLMLVGIAPAVLAQQANELAGTIGRMVITHQVVPGTNFMGNSVAFGDGISFDATFAHYFKRTTYASFALELPFVMDIKEKLNYGKNVVPASYQSYFVTPSARLVLIPNLLLSPWASLGGGFGHFSESSNLEFGGPNPGSNSTTGILQYGGGLDVRVWNSVGLRGEFRDFYSGTPKINVDTGRTRQHNRYIGIGIFWQFGG